MPTTKRVTYYINAIKIEFFDETGRYHRERGRPAIITYDNVTEEKKYEYYIHGERIRPRKNDKDQPTIVVIGLRIKIYTYVNFTERGNANAERPFYVKWRSDGECEIRYSTATVMCGLDYKYVENADGDLIAEYSLNYNNLGAYVIIGQQDRVTIAPEYARSFIPHNIPRSTIMNTPLAYFKPF